MVVRLCQKSTVTVNVFAWQFRVCHDSRWTEQLMRRVSKESTTDTCKIIGYWIEDMRRRGVRSVQEEGEKYERAGGAGLVEVGSRCGGLQLSECVPKCGRNQAQSNRKMVKYRVQAMPPQGGRRIGREVVESKEGASQGDAR